MLHQSWSWASLSSISNLTTSGRILIGEMLTIYIPYIEGSFKPFYKIISSAPCAGPCWVHGRQQPLHHQEREGPRQRRRCADTSRVWKRSQEAAIGWGGRNPATSVSPVTNSWCFDALRWFTEVLSWTSNGRVAFKWIVYKNALIHWW